MKKIFKNKKVLVMGLGIAGGGVGTVKFFCRQGAKVLVTDLRTEKELKESIKKLKRLPVKYVLGRHRKEDFVKADLIIKGPGVPADSPYLKIAKKNNISVKTDVEIFFEFSKAFIIGITGTRGKSTTAALLYNFLKEKYPHKVFLGGNIGVSLLDFLEKAGKESRVVLELSSFQLENLKKSPQIAVFTNLYPDHLNRYKGMRDYISAKKNIFRHQKKKDILILNYDDPRVRKFLRETDSRVYFFSRKKGLKTLNSACFLKGDDIFFAKEKKPVFNVNDLKIKGRHNIDNVLGAVSAAKVLKVSLKNIRKVLFNFKGIAFRQEFIAEKKGVKYFNDTTATIPEAAITALNTFSREFPDSKIILISGGEDKSGREKINYKNLASLISEKADFLFLLPGSASDKIKKNLDSLKYLNIVCADSLERAVRKAAIKGRKGDIILFSPGAASFNLFKNEFDRGKQFNELVKKL